MIPSGYKASKVYSVLPTDGTGDFTFSRAGALPSFNATRVNSEGLIEEVLSNVPRLDYSDGGCPSLLVEPQSTNLLTYSEDFSDASWTKTQTTITANATISPSGTTTADKFIPSALSIIHQVEKNITAPSGNVTISFFAKKEELSQIGAVITGGGIVGSLTSAFDLNTKSFFIGTGSFSNFPNDWVRISITTPTDGTALSVRFRIYSAGIPTFAGNGMDGLYFWGAQLEALRYASSYIPTVASTVTRVADVVSKTGISSLIGQTEGTLYVEGTFNAQTSATKRILSLSDGTINNEILIQNPLNSNNIQFVVIDAASTVVAVTVSNKITFGTNFKVAFVYSENYFVAYFNGEKIAEDLSGSVPLCSKVTLGRGNNTTLHEGTVKNLQVYTTALSDLEIETITSYTSFEEMALALDYTIEITL
jgi:hypothetical protein